MRTEHDASDKKGVVADTVDLVSRARQRTLEEFDALSCNDSISYGVAISGNTPYVALPNGITIVMRRCNNWSC